MFCSYKLHISGWKLYVTFFFFFFFKQGNNSVTKETNTFSCWLLDFISLKAKTHWLCICWSCVSTHLSNNDMSLQQGNCHLKSDGMHILFLISNISQVWGLVCSFSFTADLTYNLQRGQHTWSSRVWVKLHFNVTARKTPVHMTSTNTFHCWCVSGKDMQGGDVTIQSNFPISQLKVRGQTLAVTLCSSIAFLSHIHL